MDEVWDQNPATSFLHSLMKYATLELLRFRKGMKSMTIRCSSRFSPSCAWAVPLVDRRPDGERHVQDVARFNALMMMVLSL